MKYKILALILFTLPLSVWARESFSESFNRFRNDKVLKNASISFKLINAENNKTIAEYNPEKSLVPASIQKLITTGLGFINLSKDFRFTTDLAYDGIIGLDSVLHGNLYIVGGGDPTFASESFPNTKSDTIFSFFYHQLKQAGISSISGDIIVNTSYFSDESKHPTWEWEDIGTYYGAGVYSLNYRENAFDLRVECLQNDSILLSGVPFDSTIRIVKKLAIVNSDSASTLSLFSSPLQEYYYLYGNIARNSSNKLSCALQNPAESCGKQFRHYLENNGISISGIIRLSETKIESSLHSLTKWQSPKYSDIAFQTNSQSNNVFADVIAKQIAKSEKKNTSYKETSEVFKRLLTTKGLNIENIRLVDGSGLSRQNLISASFMCDFLKVMNKYPEFKASIPVPGDKGTMKYFMASNKNRKKVRVKSGSMTSVISYAGYVKNNKGQEQYLSIIINNFTCKSSIIRKKLEELIGEITLSE